MNKSSTYTIKKQFNQQLKPNQQKQKLKQIYFYHFPFRAIIPYDHKYQTHAKARWYQKPLLQTLIKQFKAYDYQYYKYAIKSGKITINNKNVTQDYIIKNGDKLVHKAIRQQPPILNLPIEIIQENQEYLIVNKPPSMTVHTGGGFHFNTLMSILKYQYGYPIQDLFILHRLDRLTSGLIILGKNKNKPQIFHRQNQNQTIKKMYYARVKGNFQWNQILLDAEIQCISHKDGIYKVSKEYKNQYYVQWLGQKKIKVHIKGKNQKPLNQNKKQKNKIKDNSNPDIKMSQTFFKKVFYHYESDSSLLQCYPITGRTHQIRVHLQYLGYSILNDIVYDGKFVGNYIIQKIQKQQKQKGHPELNYQTKNINFKNKRQLKDYQKNLSIQQNKLNEIQTNRKIIVNEQIVNSFLNKQNQNKMEQCQNQRIKKRQEQKQKLIKVLQNEWDYKTKPWQIYLHSYKYTLQGKTYRTQKPYWAEYDFTFK